MLHKELFFPQTFSVLFPKRKKQVLAYGFFHLPFYFPLHTPGFFVYVGNGLFVISVDLLAESLFFFLLSPSFLSLPSPIYSFLLNPPFFPPSSFRKKGRLTWMKPFTFFLASKSSSPKASHYFPSSPFFFKTSKVFSFWKKDSFYIITYSFVYIIYSLAICWLLVFRNEIHVFFLVTDSPVSNSFISRWNMINTYYILVLHY